MAEEIKDATIEAWFRERCRCEVCGAVATLGDLESCESCTDSIWRHHCPVDGEDYIEHQIEHDRNRIRQQRDRLLSAVNDLRSFPADRAKQRALYSTAEAVEGEQDKAGRGA